MSPLESQPYDAARFLRDEEDCRAYLEASREDGDPQVIAMTEAVVTRWRATRTRGTFLGLLEQDIATHPERLRAVDADVLQRVRSLVGETEVDLDVSLPADGD